MGNEESVLGAAAAPPAEDAAGNRYFVRLNASEKLQHMIFAACFIVLVVTGFMLKIPDSVVRSFGKAGEIVFNYRSIVNEKK